MLGGDWHVCVLRPGAAPLTALAASLTKLLPAPAMQDYIDMLDALARDAGALTCRSRSRSQIGPQATVCW